MKFVRDLFTEKDNATWDLNRVLFATGALTVFGGFLWAIAFNHQPVAWLEMGGGAAAVLGGGGGALALNRKNQNGADDAH